MNKTSLMLILFVVLPCSLRGQVTPLPAPEINVDSWVLIEIWPDVEDITLAAYFLDSSFDKNESLCEATKRVFDRDHATREVELGRELTSYRVCMPLSQARAEGYVRVRG